MTSVSQLLPNFIQGINEQPDELKKPGQVRDAVNVYPDVTTGLSKRTGYECVTTNIDTNGRGTWFVLRRRDERNKYKKYVFLITKNGIIRGWDVDSGKEQTIWYHHRKLDISKPLSTIKDEELELASNISYLKTSSNFQIKTAVKEDSAFIVNTEKKLENSASTGIEERPYEAFIEITTLDVSRAYTINFDKVGTESTQTTIASRIDFVDVDNFDAFGSIKDDENDGNDDGTCTKVGTYTVQTKIATASVDGEDCPRDQPVIVRVTISAQPGNRGDGDQVSCNYYVSDTKLLSGGAGWKVDDEFEVQIPGAKEIDGEIKYMEVKYKVLDVIKSKGPVDYINISAVPDPDNLSVLPILDQLSDSIEETVNPDNDLDFATQIIGNGLYVKAGFPFKIDTAEKDLINVLSNFAEYVQPDPEDVIDGIDQRPITEQYPNPYAVVNNVSNLPIECKPGFVVKVANSFTTEDDYYVRFVREYNDFAVDNPDGTNKTIVSGVGYWKEIAKPGEVTLIKFRTLPYIIKFRETNYNSQTVNDWIISGVKWAARSVGTYDQFTPSMVGQTINNICFYRNRLIFLSGSSIVSSQAGDFTNLYPSTALTTSASDPIDLQADSSFSPNLHAAIEVNNALVIFGEYNQFILTTDSDIFSPSTAKVSRISGFQFKVDSEPFMIGTNIGFLGGDDDYTALYEMTNLFREGQVDVIERSKPISKKIGPRFIIVDSSRKEGLIILGSFSNKRLWVHKYFKENSQNDIQQAWVRWELNDDVVFQFFDQGRHYVIARHVYDPAVWGDKDPTCGIFSNDFDSDKYQDDMGDNGGPINYPMKIVLPTFFITKAEQQSFRADTTASLIIHRIHLNTGLTNFYDVNIKRYGKDDYLVRYEQSIQDAFNASGSDDPLFQPVTFDREETIPLYERNVNLSISIESEFPSPFTLYSMRWEGDYNPKFYKRV